MKKFLLAAGILLSMSSLAHAAIQTTNYNLSGLNDLAHEAYYTYGINPGINLSEVSITAASITFTNIINDPGQNNNNYNYALWVQLLDHKVGANNTPVPVGVKSYSDSGDSLTNPTNAFGSNGELLKVYTSGIPQVTYPYYNHAFHRTVPTGATITYTFTNADLVALSTDLLLNSGIIGLGFDSDCHFYDSNVSFSITTASNQNQVPEPATMLLFGTGLAGLAAVRLRRNKN